MGRSQPSSKVAFTIAAFLVSVALAGCATTEETQSDGPSRTSGVSEATQALWDAGLKDPYLDVEPTGEVQEFDFYVNDFSVVNPYGDEDLYAVAFSEDPDGMGTVPGPEIRVKQGDTVRVTLHSPDSAFPGHTMHWHGIDLPWESDGVPFTTQDIADANQAHEYTYEFVAKQAGTYWYHCVTAFPVDLEFGLFGPLIIEPQDQEADLPFDREETLMFHEMDSQWAQAVGWALNDNMDPEPGDFPSNPFDVLASAQNQARGDADLAASIVGGATGQYTIAEGPRPYYPEFSPRYKPHYDTFMINGKSYPDTEPMTINEGETLRIRLINAAQAHKSIHLHGHHVLVTHVDGYPLEQPIWEDTVSLAPGERKDVYVQGTNPGIWKLHDHSGVAGSGTTNANDYAFPGGQITALAYEDFDPPGGLAGYEEGDTAGELALFAPSGWR